VDNWESLILILAAERVGLGLATLIPGGQPLASKKAAHLNIQLSKSFPASTRDATQSMLSFIRDSVTSRIFIGLLRHGYDPLARMPSVPAIELAHGCQDGTLPRRFSSRRWHSSQS
jgi:hypothetical protein